MKRSEMEQQVEDFITNILGEYEPEEVLKAAEQLRTIFNDCLDRDMQMQEALNERNEEKKKHPPQWGNQIYSDFNQWA